MSIQPVLITIDEFGALGGVKRTLAYALLKRPGAPKPIQVGPKTVRYRYDEARTYWASLPAADRAEPAELQRGRVYRAGQPIGAPASDPTTAAA